MRLSQLFGKTQREIAAELEVKRHTIITMFKERGWEARPSAPRREEVRFWYNNTLTNMLEPDGKLINIATKWHEDDISNYFSKLPNFTYKVYKGILNEEEIEQGKKPKVLWPKR